MREKGNGMTVDDLVITHRPSGITGRAEDVFPLIDAWIHENHPDQLCMYEGIFKDPKLNKPCPNRKKKTV